MRQPVLAEHGRVTSTARVTEPSLRGWLAQRRARQVDAVAVDLSASLAQVPAARIDREIDRALPRIARAFDADRVGIIEAPRPDGCMVFAHRWCTDRVTPLPASLCADDVPTVGARFLRGDVVRFLHPDDLPPAAAIDRATYERHAYTSSVLVPLDIEGRVVAGLELSTSGRERDWADAQVRRLQAVAAAVAGAWRVRAAIEAGRRSDALSAGVLDSLGAQVAVTDRCGTIVRVNEAWQRFSATCGGMLGVGANYLDAWRRRAAWTDGAPAAAALDRMEAALRGEWSGRPVEYTCCDVTWEIAMAPLRVAEGGVVISQLDVTARKRAERDADQRRREAAHVARVATVGGLTASLAHELNQPLTAIRSNAQTALRYHPATPGADSEMPGILDDIVADATRAAEIIDRMRGLLRDGTPSVSALDVNEVVRTVTRLLASDAVIRRATLAHELDAAIPAIRADRVQLQQVLLNLMLNALEAVDSGANAERRVTICTRCLENGHVLLTVRDTGPGVDIESGRLFKPFHSTKPGGLGVGLSISRTIVEAHGGSVWAENNETGGASFHIRLPADAEAW